MTKISKPIVSYIEILPIVVGECAIILPVDHPSDRVSNTFVARTSIVLNYDNITKSFETENTLYIQPRSNSI